MDKPSPKPVDQPAYFKTSLGPDETSLYKTLIENLSEGVYFVDQRRSITFWNQGAERLSGFTAQEVSGRYCGGGLLRHEDEDGRCLCGEACPLKQTMRDGNSREIETYLWHKLGYRIPVSIYACAIRDSRGEIVGAVEVFRDASAKKRLEHRADHLEELAYRDPLTAAANRRYVELKLDQMIQDVQQLGRRIGLILVDLDNFKQINDTRGHEVGDRVLQEVSRVLSRHLRPRDIIGRWGGEEFLVLLLDPKLEDIEKVAERCRTVIASARIGTTERPIQVTASIGTTPVFGGDSRQSAIARADKLMYESKAMGKNRVTGHLTY